MNMSLFHRKAKPAPYDAEKLQPAVRKSYCNREMTLGFLVKETGQFRSCCAATTQKELEAFCREYGIRPEDLKTFY